MRRIKLLTNWKQYKAGDTAYVTPNEAFGLIDSGKAKLTKDVASVDYTVKKVKYGKSTKLRPNHKS